MTPKAQSLVNQLKDRNDSDLLVLSWEIHRNGTHLNGTHSIQSFGLMTENQIIGNRKTGDPGVIPQARSTWWKGIREGRYPKGVKFGSRTLWDAAEIIELAKRVKSGEFAESNAA